MENTGLPGNVLTNKVIYLFAYFFNCFKQKKVQYRRVVFFCFIRGQLLMGVFHTVSLDWLSKTDLLFD